MDEDHAFGSHLVANPLSSGPAEALPRQDQTVDPANDYANSDDEEFRAAIRRLLDVRKARAGPAVAKNSRGVGKRANRNRKNAVAVQACDARTGPAIDKSSRCVGKRANRNRINSLAVQACDVLKMIAETLSCQFSNSTSRSSDKCPQGVLRCQKIMEAMGIDSSLYFRSLEFFMAKPTCCDVFIAMESSWRLNFLHEVIPPDATPPPPLAP